MRPSGVITAMTDDLDTASKNVDRQSVDLWNEVKHAYGMNAYLHDIDKDAEE